MVLIVCGNVSADEILAIVDRHLPDCKSAAEIEKINENAGETPAVFQSETVQYMQVAKPLFNIGFKDVAIPENGDARQRKDAAMAILDEMLFSRAGALYASLFERDLISPAFSYGYTISESCAYHSLAGEADNPREVLAEIRKYLENVKKDGLSLADFERSKRVLYAEFVKSFDSTDSIANNLFSFLCEDSDLLRYAEFLDAVTFEEVVSLFETAFREEYTALSIVMPLSQS